MNPHPCCQIASPGRVRRASRWQRGGELAGWLVPGATLVLMPKCPLCVAAYVAVFSGVGLSFASASVLRTSLITLCVTVLLCLALIRLRRLIFPAKAFQISK